MDEEILPFKEDGRRVVSTANLDRAFSQLTSSPVTFTNAVLQEAIELGASDILFEPGKRDVRVRLRID